MGMRCRPNTRAGLFYLAAIVLFLLFAGPVWSADVKIANAVVCRAVDDRQPVDAATEFPASVGKVFCYTVIEAASPPAQIAHLWYYQDKLVHEFTLPVHAARFRTWSSKNIFPGMTGQWRVDIVDASGKTIIGSVSFRIH